MKAYHVEREALVKKLQSEADFAFADYRGDDGRGLEKAIEIINHFKPAADVAPVMHSRWTPNRDGTHFCLECGVNAPFQLYKPNSDMSVPHYRIVERLSGYCPNCGSKMDA